MVQSLLVRCFLARLAVDGDRRLIRHHIFKDEYDELLECQPWWAGTLYC